MLSWSSRDKVPITAAPEIASDDVAAERQRETFGAVRPPFAEIDDFLQSLFGVCQLSLVNQQARRELAGMHPFLNLIERDDDVLNRRVEQPQRQKCRRQLAGDRDPHTVERRRSIGLRDDHRTVAVPHARSVRQQHVAIGEMRVGMERNRRNLVLAIECVTIERLDVREHVFQLEPLRGHTAGREAVEHERVIRIGAVSDANLHRVLRVLERAWCFWCWVLWYWFAVRRVCT